MIEKISNFFTEMMVELKKVSWPSQNELLGSTAVVIISVIIMAAYIGVCDYVFSTAVHFLIR